MEALVSAAREVLKSHDGLKFVQSGEPDAGTEPESWLRWHKTLYKPAYQRWTDSLDDLQGLMPEPISHHPYNFRPVCERIIDEAAAATREP